VRDLFNGQMFVRMLAGLAMINGLAPVIAQLLSAQLLDRRVGAPFSWR
jgi:hypothetical protein